MFFRKALLSFFVIAGICIFNTTAQTPGIDEFRDMKIFIDYEGTEAAGISGFISNPYDQKKCKDAIEISLRLYQSVIPQLNFSFVDYEVDATHIFFFANFEDLTYRVNKTGTSIHFGGLCKDNKIYINDAGYEFSGIRSPINFNRFTYMSRDRMLDSYVPAQLPIQNSQQWPNYDQHTYTATDPISGIQTYGACDLVRLIYHELGHMLGLPGTHPTIPPEQFLNFYGSPSSTQAPYNYPDPVANPNEGWLDYYLGGGTAGSPWTGALNKLTPVNHMNFANPGLTRGAPGLYKFNNRYIQDFDLNADPFWDIYRVVYPEVMQGIIEMKKVDRTTTYLTTNWREAFETGQMKVETQSNPFMVNKIHAKAKYSRYGAGYSHSAAIKANGTLWTWGRNDYGQIGAGYTGGQVTSPVQPNGTGADWVAVSCGTRHTVALKNDGTLWAWGDNSNGQLGDGTTTSRTVPTEVIRASGFRWISVAAGYYHTIALRNDGTVWTWGNNNYGQLGNLGSIGGQNSTPTIVGTDKDWVQVDAGHSYNSAALKEDGRLYVWGYGSDGQLGYGWGHYHAPQIIISGTPTNMWASVSVGYKHIMAIAKDGTLWGWGRNDYGQTGDGTTTKHYNAIQVGTADDWVFVDAGGYHTIGIRGNTLNRGGTLWGWGRNSYSQITSAAPHPCITPFQIGSADDWASAKLGHFYSMVVDTFGTVSSVGYNAYGQLGDGSTSNRTSLVTIPWRVNQAPIVTATDPQSGNSFDPFTSPQAAVNTRQPTWTWESQSPATPKLYRRRLDNSDLSSATQTTNTSYTPWYYLHQGVHTLYVQEQDAMGTWSETGSFSVKVDRTDPILTVTESTVNPYYTGCWLGAVANEPIQCITYTSSGSEPTQASTVYSTPLDIKVSGTYKFKAWDLAGRASATITKNFDIKGAYVESGDMIVVEAEHYSRNYAWNVNTMEAIDPENARWIPESSVTGYSGTGYVTTPDIDGPNATYGSGSYSTGCYLRYLVKTAPSGSTYKSFYMWARIRSPKASSNSVIVTSNRNYPFMKQTTTDNTWEWVKFGYGSFLTDAYAQAFVIRHEDGCLVDKVLFTTDNTYTPSGMGPSESSREP